MKFKVGDKVYCLYRAPTMTYFADVYYKSGIVISVYDNKDTKVRFDFNNAVVEVFDNRWLRLCTKCPEYLLNV